jgi:putative ABC transport system ATP-binding protein
MIELKKVCKLYQAAQVETLALKDIDLHIRKGEFASVMGPSGCGKSTLLNLIGLLDRPDQGSIVLGGAPVSSYRDKDTAMLRNETFGFIFQNFHLINDLRVIDNVELPLLYRPVSSSERRRRALEAIARVGLEARARHYPNQLSGGQQQRVAIARAIVGDPAVLLADEPTGNLDSKMGAHILDLLLELNRDGKTIVMVTHNDKEAQRAGRIIRVHDGQLVAEA